MLGYSAVIIARNEERHIKETVESILKQSIKPYRIIVVDDGSTDSTPEILGTMPATVKRLPDHDRGSTVYCNTLSDVRNAGLAYIRDDPVDWVYSGDADIVLPPRYCESIMRHAGERDAYIAAGIIGDKLDYLPMEGCMMIRHNWLKSVGMETKWESIYLCVKALAQGKSTLVCHTGDCTVVSQRRTGQSWMPERMYNRGKLGKRMGMPLGYALFRSLRIILGNEARGRTFYKGWFDAKMEVSREMSRTYRMLLKDDILCRRLGRFGYRSKMFHACSEGMICHPPG